MNCPCAQRLCVGRQRNRPGPSANDRNVKRDGSHLFAHRIERREPIWIRRRGQESTQRSSQREQLEIWKHVWLLAPHLLPTPELRANRVCERTYNQNAFRREMLAPRTLVIVRFQRGQVCESRSRGQLLACGILAKIEPYRQHVKMGQRLRVRPAKP